MRQVPLNPGFFGCKVDKVVNDEGLDNFVICFGNFIKVLAFREVCCVWLQGGAEALIRSVPFVHSCGLGSDSGSGFGSGSGCVGYRMLSPCRCRRDKETDAKILYCQY